MEVRNFEQLIETRMRAAGVGTPTIRAFLSAARRVADGERGLLPESAVEPIASLPRREDFAEPGEEAAGFLRELAVIKLNGGLGTGMGLDRPKSLIRIKGEDTFLDFIARQILSLRAGRNRAEPGFYLMDSFATQRETLEYLGRYPELAEALAALHPYEVPEIVALEPAAVAESYLAWVLASTRPE